MKSSYRVFSETLEEYTPLDYLAARRGEKEIYRVLITGRFPHYTLVPQVYTPQFRDIIQHDWMAFTGATSAVTELGAIRKAQRILKNHMASKGETL